MESKAQTILAARANNPSTARIMQDERTKNHTERLALKILGAMENPETYDIIRMDETRLRLGAIIKMINADAGELRTALQAIHNSFEALEHKLEHKDHNGQSVQGMLHTDKGLYQIFFIFNDLDKPHHADMALDYIKENRSDLAKGIRTAIFGETGHYIQ